MEILVINLMRLGDLVQAGPVLRGLKRRYPQARLTLAAMDVFQEPARLLPEVDRLLLFPSLKLAAALDGPDGWPQAFRRLRAWFAEHLSPPPDLVVNLTPNLLGAIFCLAAGSREVRGLAVESRGEFYTVPAWASYSLVASLARMANPFNIVDLFLRGAGLTPDGGELQVHIPAAAQAEADAAIQALALAPGTALVGLCPGASAPARQWPPTSFARMAKLLSQARPCHFVVLGSAPEVSLGEAIRSQLPAGQVTLCQGRTSLSGLAAYLRRLDLLVTNDTGPMHLAAAVGAPVVALFLATARARDTGPAGRGHLAIEPDLDCHPCLAPCGQPRCHKAIRPEAVAELALGLLEKPGRLPSAGLPSQRGLRAFVTEIDLLGYQAYLPVCRQPLSRREFWVWVHRLAWSAILDDQEADLERCRSWITRILSQRHLAPIDDLGVAAGRRFLGEIRRIAARGESTARRLSAWADRGCAFPERLRQGLDVFAKLDAQLRRLAVEFPELAAIPEFFFQDQRRPGPTEVVPLIRELAQTYGSLSTIAACFLEAVQALATLPALARREELAQEVAQEMQLKFDKTQELPSRVGETPCW